ncbi:MAG: ABC transporter ATP-binding protein/permease [Oscillospiraceae bacterium]|nr:ABC transporter ATP-binding protein/permease [Oscillospiraceae bacterium]
MKKKIKAIGWAFSLAWRFNKKILIGWSVLLSVVSVLPAVALYYNRAIITELNSFLTTGTGAFGEILSVIIMFGIITALIGLSNRLNVEFVYSVMYDTYYFGMVELLIDGVQKISFEELLDKEVKDEFFAAAFREGSLTDVISSFCTLLGKFVGTASLLIVAFSLSKLIFAIASAYTIGIIWLNLIFVEKLRYNWQKIRDKERLAAHYENMPYSQEYAKELRVFESRETLYKNWKEAYKPIYDYQIKNTVAVELRSFISGFGFYIFLAAMIVYSLFAVAGGTMTAAVLLVIFTLCMNIYTSITGIARTLMLADHGLYALERQYKYFSAPAKNADNAPAAESRPTKTDTVFKTEDLTYSYKSEKYALDHVSIEIKRGETVALVGANGSGKSTLVNTLLQIYKPPSGKLFYNGMAYGDFEQGFLKNSIGAFFQDYYLFHLPVFENVGFGDIENIGDMDKISRALEKGGAAGFVMKLPKGGDTFIRKDVEETGADFSGGERQKIAVSRAHMSDKDILIFDEPASMLDPIAELEQFTHIKEKIEGSTAILISHRVGFARLADRIILLDNGKVAEVGTHDELMKKNGLYANFFNEQAQWYV